MPHPLHGADSSGHYLVRSYAAALRSRSAAREQLSLAAAQPESPDMACAPAMSGEQVEAFGRLLAAVMMLQLAGAVEAAACLQ